MKIILTILLLCLTHLGRSESKPKAVYETDSDILYHKGDNLTDYMKERCRLDVYHPKHIRNFPTVIWFHGGGLKAGNRRVPAELQEKGIAVVAVNYRLHPKVKSPAYVEDAAAAVAHRSSRRAPRRSGLGRARGPAGRCPGRGGRRAAADTLLPCQTSRCAPPDLGTETTVPPASARSDSNSLPQRI